MESTVTINTTRHTGRIPQTIIYLGKLFRMFIFQNDWKVLPMSAVIASLISFAVGANLFKTMEGTLTGTFAVSCICIWNGFFNSIQSICRERPIIKREHRSGLHITSYIAAHTIYQAFLCMLQSVITIAIFSFTRIALPQKSLITKWPLLDLWLTLFLLTFCADMLALMVSAIARNTTTAMTVMPFLLIFQLIFSGSFFNLPESAKPISNITISKWGLTALCAQGDYNSLPMVSIWNSAFKMKVLEVEGEKPVFEMLKYIEENNMKDEILMQTGQQNQIPEYNFDKSIVYNCWEWLVVWTILYIVVATGSLELIDRDRR